MNIKHINANSFLMMLMVLTLLFMMGPVSAGSLQPRKTISAKNKSMSSLHFFGMDQDTFDKDKVDFDKGWIGIYMENVEEKGVLVKMVVKGSPADIFGLQTGDIVTKVNGTEIKGEGVSNIVLFKRIIEETGKGNIADLEIIREGKQIEIKLKLIGKLLKPSDGYDQIDESKDAAFYINKLNARALNYDESFLKVVFSDKEFKDKCLETIQRIGEEVFVREGYQSNKKMNIFRLPLVDYLMTHPFDVPDTVTFLHDEFMNRNQIEIAINILDSNKKKSIDRSNSINNANVQAIIESMLKDVYNCLRLRKELLSDLKEDELRFLYDNAPDVWLSSNGIEIEKIAKFLEIAAKIDMSRLMDNLRMAVDAIPVKLLRQIKLENIKLNLFDLNDLEIQNHDNQAINKGADLDGSVSGFDGDVLFVQETDMGKIVIGGPGTTYYYDDAAFIIDLGGDDYYFNNAGSSRHGTPIGVCLDFAGDDVYNAKKDFSQGSARFGAGILIDLNGDDKYIAGDYSQGIGIFGIGLLYDTNGDDLYNAQSVCQGGGAFGVGIMYDTDGNDYYSSRRFSQGLGLTKGVGGIIDLSGNDQYFAGGKYTDFRNPEMSFQSFSQGFGMGIRPDESIVGASGGIGFLFDEKGNDTYSGDYFCQGSSYYFSLGILYDKSGHDRYYSGRYSQGAGIHSTIGVLKDDEGNDTYNAYFGVAQACGYDTGIGYIIDLKGDDYYKSNVMSQGTGGEKGLGVLVDFSGNDYYHANVESQGYSYPSMNEKFFGIGILGDVGGTSDVFNNRIENDTLNYRVNAGILLNKGNKEKR